MSRKSPNIIVRGATHNNLKGISLEISPGELTVITGLSGTGKSTLLFDVLHAEGQRKYLETFGSYVRQFLDSIPRPKVEEITNARPSIAVEQKNTVRNSRSTVGTMTEVCDYFKVWFSQAASLHDPEDNSVIENKTADRIAEDILSEFDNASLIFGFTFNKPEKLSKKEFLAFLRKAGHCRILIDGKFLKIDSFPSEMAIGNSIFVIIDKIIIRRKHKKRISESISLCLKFGDGLGEIRNLRGERVDAFTEGLKSKVNGRTFQSPEPDFFSFNSPRGACPSCKGFGKTIGIDIQKVIPDENNSIRDNAIKPFSGRIYCHCKKDLTDNCSTAGIDPKKPYAQLSETQKSYIWEGDRNYEEGEDGWYGINKFFSWLEKKTYKMHVRVFLSKYRGYFTCKDCNGSRLNREALHWKWKGRSLPDLYALPIEELLSILPKKTNRRSPQCIALDSILSRLSYLVQVGLGYLSLDRPSQTLSGGETQRVNLTACLGSGLTDTLFALDEPTIGLHGKDVGSLIDILKQLAESGNCVCVVEHDEQVIRAADKIIEIGPEPGAAGGRLSFQGTPSALIQSKTSNTGQWLRRIGSTPKQRAVKRSFSPRGSLEVKNASLHNLRNFSVSLPLGRFVCITGVSGSGKSTLVNELIYPSLSEGKGDRVSILNEEYDEVSLIDQNSVSKTPRSNPILYVDGWAPVKDALARSNQAKKLGYGAADFSFNSGNGRCEECKGLGYEVVDMQFLSNVQTPCPYCKGMRFKEEVLSITLNGHSVFDLLNLTVSEALQVLRPFPKTYRKLNLLKKIGLGYLTLGQPLNTLSGGESQRLKLSKYISDFGRSAKKSILLIDEPSTGLHMEDVHHLINTLNSIVEAGHSLFVIEHNAQIIANSDWILELGPGAGAAGGKVVANHEAKSFKSLDSETSKHVFKRNSICQFQKKQSVRKKKDSARSIVIEGARENNLKNLSLAIPHHEFVVVTGPSGSGKSSLAFDLIFAEGQRRFMDSMSSYARQFIEQMPRPKVDQINGMKPTVAIEQRATRGSRKSTVGSVTEIMQYLRLLYAKVGIQLSEGSLEPLQKSSFAQVEKRLKIRISSLLAADSSKLVYLLAPLVIGRKGHHRPIVNWALQNGFRQVRCDKVFFETSRFEGLDRYRVHDVEAVISTWNRMPSPAQLREAIKIALEVGNGSCLLMHDSLENDEWHSIRRIDPQTGISYPDLEPAHFSWNSSKGMCGTCRGYGKIMDWMKDELPASDDWWNFEEGAECPSCNGQRLGKIGRNVVLNSKKSTFLSFPGLLSREPGEIVDFLSNLKVGKSERIISDDIIPEITERLRFMEGVGLKYLTLDRETSTLSGGEAQRIRLAGQLGSNLSGVLYVLDEPSIGLHPVDNQRLLDSLRKLQQKGNSLLVVEHDEETIEQADFTIEIGPSAGEGGGQVISAGSKKSLNRRLRNKRIEKQKKEVWDLFFRESWKLPAGKTISNSPNWLHVRKGTLRNLKGVCVKIPLGRLTVCCGASGSGKSTLIRGILLKNAKEAISAQNHSFKSDYGYFSNFNAFSKAIEVDQKPIGKTSRSTPVTYLGIWDRIRTLFSQLPEANARGYTPSHFSFNVKGGRCESCKGNGRIKLEMSFLPDTYVECSDCKGARFANQILELQWKSKSISEVLEMTMEQASIFFEFDRFLRDVFLLMTETGLGYLRLGQTSPTLSGGEAQRLKLVAELAKSIEKSSLRLDAHKKPTLYVLEEPTIGLHHQDRLKLFKLLRRLVDEGNTVIVIEHDLDLISHADYVIEMGPGGGRNGGKCIFQGTPTRLRKSRKSVTAAFLR